MKTEALWNDVVLHQPDGQFSLGTDAVACAHFARFPKGSNIADLGCGSGAIALMLLANDASCQVTGIELEHTAAEAAKLNSQGLSFSVLEADLRQIRTLLPPGCMDCVISNPPYFPVGSGQTAKGVLARARSEETCTLAQLTDAAAWLLPTGGRFVLVHRPERLADLVWELRRVMLEPKRIRFVRHSAKNDVSLVLLEARKGGKPGLQYEPDLILYNEDGIPTREYLQMYHKE